MCYIIVGSFSTRSESANVEVADGGTVPGDETQIVPAGLGIGSDGDGRCHLNGSETRAPSRAVWTISRQSGGYSEGFYLKGDGDFGSHAGTGGTRHRLEARSVESQFRRAGPKLKTQDRRGRGSH